MSRILVLNTAVALGAAGMLVLSGPATAQEAMRPGFHAGTVITEFGPVATIEGREALPATTKFSVVFDVADAAEPGSINRTLESAARFINMHAEAGIPPEAVRVAIVVHGPASADVANAATYGKKHDGAKNVNLAAIAALLELGVEIHVCGQSATAQGITAKDLAPGVTMSLSAMTAHALLQQQGFTLNPF